MLHDPRVVGADVAVGQNATTRNWTQFLVHAILDPHPCGSEFFEGSVTKPRRTFVTDLVTDLCNKTSWLVTHPALHTPRHTPSLHTSDEQTRPVT